MTIKVAGVLAGAPQGGAENFYTRFMSELKLQSSYEVRSFTRANERRDRLFSAVGLPIEHFKFGGPLNFIDRWAYHRALRSYAPDAVLTFMNRATAVTPPGRYQLIARLGHYYNYKYYHHCNYWIGITKGICDHLLKGGMPQERIIHIPNFVDEQTAPSIPRTSFTTDESEPIILAFGRLHVNKAFDTLLSAVSRLPRGVLWLAGTGPEQQALQTQAQSLGITDRVRFLGWREDINALLATADLFVCPSRHEGLGSIILESWFHGCPIVATASQGPAELIDHGRTGLVVPVDDVAALTLAIKEALDDEPLRQELVEAGRTEYQTKYSARKIIAQYQEFLESVV